jgi:hypothetical protein
MTRWTRRPGVKANTFQAPMRPRLMGAAVYPAAYSRIVGTPITLGGNDVHSDCVTVGAFNATMVANGRRSIMTPCTDAAPFELFTTLGGMPADDGLDPATLFNYWQANSIYGYRLGGIEAIALDDVSGMEQAIIDTGFVYFTAVLDEAQMMQKDWTPVGGPVDGGHATILTWWEAGFFYDETWGIEVRVSPDFIAKQGLNIWRLDLTPA